MVGLCIDSLASHFCFVLGLFASRFDGLGTSLVQVNGGRSLPDAVRVKINVHNTLGQFVVQLTDNVQAAGSYDILWDGKNAAGIDVATGMYIYQIKAGSFVDAKKMLLLK